MKIVKFPMYLAQAVKHESPGFEAPRGLDRVVLSLFQAEQLFDFFEACAFAESHILTQDLAAIEPKELQNLILQLHAKIANSLCLLNGHCYMAGMFLPARMVVWRETGIAGKEFVRSFYYQQANEEILNEINPELGAQYRSFCQKLNDKAVKHMRDSNVQGVDMVDFIFSSGLSQDPDFAGFCRIASFGEAPENKPQKFQEYCVQLSQMLSDSNVDPFVVASFAHQELVRMHLFPNGNGRLARLVMNIVLMHFGVQPIQISFEDYEAYTLITERDLVGDGDFTAYLKLKSSVLRSDQEVLAMEEMLTVDPYTLLSSWSGDPKDFIVMLHPMVQCYDLVAISDNDKYCHAVNADKKTGHSFFDNMDLGQEKAYVKYKFDSAEFFRLANKYKDSHSHIAFYFYMRAIQCDKQINLSQSIDAYFNMALISQKERCFGVAKFYLQKAATLAEAEKDAVASQKIKVEIQKLPVAEDHFALLNAHVPMQYDDGIRKNQVLRASRLGTIAINHFRAKRYSVAGSCFLRAYRLLKKYEGETHISSARALYNFAAALHEIGRSCAVISEQADMMIPAIEGLMHVRKLTQGAPCAQFFSTNHEALHGKAKDRLVEIQRSEVAVAMNSQQR